MPLANLVIAAQTNTPAQAAKFVLIYIVATAVASSNEPRANCDPPLKPNQPSHKMNTPNVASGIDELAKGTSFPSPSNRPKRGPKIMAPAKAAAPPAACTRVEPAKSEKPAADNHPPPHCQPISIG